MAKGLEIRRRIKSVKSTKSITKAMQMVAASKMRKAQEQALKTRRYAEKALEILAAVSGNTGNYEHYLLTKRKESDRCLILLITANKGLCGSLNTNAVRKVLEFIENKPNENVVSSTFDFMTLGKKGRDALIRMGENIVADYSDIGETLSFLDIAPMAKQLLDEYKNENYDRVYIVYTHFISVLIQKTVIRRVVPLGKDILDSLQGVMTKKKIEAKDNDGKLSEDGTYEYLFEPGPKEVLEYLLPRLIEMQIYQSILEAYASEQSARMVAMKNATEAAGDLMDDLTLTYNKTRQAGITQEISEIVGGVEALKKSSK